MPSESSSTSPQAFWSYAHSDDEFLDGAICALHERLQRALHYVSGTPFEIFLDRDAIEFGENWQDRLIEGLLGARFLIPVLTPSYFASPACRAELETFLELEASLGRKDLILPLYVRNIDTLEDDGRASNDELIRHLHQRQYRDWRDLILQPLQSAESLDAIIKLAEEIVRASKNRSADDYSDEVTLSQPIEASEPQHAGLSDVPPAKFDQNTKDREEVHVKIYQKKRLAFETFFDLIIKLDSGSLEENKIQRETIHGKIIFLLDKLAEILELVTGEECGACLKMFNEDGLIRAKFRDSDSFSMRRFADRMYLPSDHREHSPFKELFDGDVGDTFWCCNDLAALGDNYRNPNKYWQRHYNATAIALMKPPFAKVGDSVLGFLCVDNKNGGFDVEVTREILQTFAACFFYLDLVLAQKMQEAPVDKSRRSKEAWRIRISQSLSKLLGE